MGGAIAVESAVRSGLALRSISPCSWRRAKQTPDESLVPEVIGLQPGQPEWRILVVDDNPENLLLLTELLAQAGFSVGEAENGAEAVAKFQAWQPHLIWMDVRMPGMDGYEATEQIRALPGGDEVKILAVTASVIDEPEKVIQDTGVDDVVLKPLGPGDLRSWPGSWALNTCTGIDRQRRRSPKDSLSAEMLADLPPELLQELNQTTLVADREATLAVIEH